MVLQRGLKLFGYHVMTVAWKLIRRIGRDTGASLHLEDLLFPVSYKFAVVLDESRGRDYRTHLRITREHDALSLLVVAYPKVNYEDATTLLDGYELAFAERMGRLHFHVMPRFLRAVEDEILSWTGEHVEHAYRSSPSYLIAAQSPWKIENGHRAGWVDSSRDFAPALFGATRAVPFALSGASFGERVEAILRASNYERAKVTLTYEAL